MRGRSNATGVEAQDGRVQHRDRRRTRASCQLERREEAGTYCTVAMGTASRAPTDPGGAGGCGMPAMRRMQMRNHVQSKPRFTAEVLRHRWRTADTYLLASSSSSVEVLASLATPHGIIGSQARTFCRCEVVLVAYTVKQLSGEKHKLFRGKQTSMEEVFSCAYRIPERLHRKRGTRCLESISLPARRAHDRRTMYILVREDSSDRLLMTKKALASGDDNSSGKDGSGAEVRLQCLRLLW